MNKLLQLCSVSMPILSAALPAMAADDFPLDCHTWNGTVIERKGIDTANASMRGIVTEPDLQAYCERTASATGEPTVAQCVASRRDELKATILSHANCKTGLITFRYGSRAPLQVKFPLARNANTSCAATIPPVIEQFKMLCPTRAKQLKMP